MLHKLIISILLLASMLVAQSESQIQYDVFSIEKEVVLPGTPEIIFDAVTGDISGWWDHTMSENPIAFYIEPFPGGGFYEIFNDEGNGVLHATVIYADRGKLLRFDGPLGLSGMAIQFVTTYQFEPVGTDSTLLTVSIHAAGEMNENTPAIVESVWDHFIFEQFEPYIKERKHIKKH